MEVHDDRSLLALQGPLGAEVLQPHVDTDLSKLYFSNFIRTDIAGIPCFLTRTGYPTLPFPLALGCGHAERPRPPPPLPTTTTEMTAQIFLPSMQTCWNGHIPSRYSFLSSVTEQACSPLRD